MVRYNAFFGHVHKRSTYKKIEVAGSFDRLAHGEEEPKGFLDVTYYSEDNRVVKFVENKDAEVYTSITLTKNWINKSKRLIAIVGTSALSIPIKKLI